MFKYLPGISPKNEGDNIFSPSTIALQLATQSKTNYKSYHYDEKYTKGQHKVMMICTEQSILTMRNGRKFLTGNHPVEMLLPVLHLQNAGFDTDVFTPGGAQVKIEEWALPLKDNAVMDFYEKYKSKFEKPGSLSEFVNKGLNDDTAYIPIFIPGGHGALLGLPHNKQLGQLLHWAKERDKYILAICHGPAALLSASLDNKTDSFLFKGYKMAVFPDSLDRITPLFGYLPGFMPWYFGDKLREQGVQIVNKSARGTCFRDRKLITGDGPKAANEFGIMAAKSLLNEIT